MWRQTQANLNRNDAILTSLSSPPLHAFKISRLTEKYLRGIIYLDSIVGGNQMEPEEIFEFLRNLSETNFVLHGSPHLVDTVVPHQSTFDGGSSIHNECGIYGTLFVELALLYALIHEDNDAWGWKLDTDAEQFLVKVPRKCKGGVGYVYVLPRFYFEKVVEGGSICIARKQIVPMVTIQIPAKMMLFLQREAKIRMEPITKKQLE